MREKNLVILCIVFAVLIGALYLKKSAKPEFPTTEVITDIIKSSVNADVVTSLTISLGDGVTADEEKPRRIEMVKSDDQWTMPTRFGVHARDTSINPVFEKIDDLKGELRSNKKQLLSDYGITDEEGVHVEILAGQTSLASVVVGTKKAGNRNNFVRLKGSNAVYIVNENLLGALGHRGEGDDQYLDENRWIDKRIAHITSGDVVGIMVQDAGSTVLDLKKETVDDKNQWQSAKPYAFGLSASKIKQAVDNINNTYANEVIAPDVEGVFDTVTWQATFALENGEAVQLTAGSKDESGNNFYLKQEGASYYFLIPESTLNSRKNQLGNIFANNPMKAEEGKMEVLEIRVTEPKKTFTAMKQAQEENSEESGGEEKKDDAWVDSAGKALDTAKVRDIINKIKAINVEVVQAPSKSFAKDLEIKITRDGVSITYTIFEEVKTNTGKECHYVGVDGGPRDYCASKSTITALRNVLP